MITATIDLVGASDLMFGKNVPDEKKASETHEAYEERMWRAKIHTTKDGQVFLNPFALKNCLEEAAKWRSDPIKGEGKKTYTARFRQGVMVIENLVLTNDKGKPLTIEDVEPRPLFVPSDGKRGGARRVYRIFPTLSEWWSTATVMIFDEKISRSIFESHIVTAGQFIGFGPMRVANGGINGRFGVGNLEWVENKEFAGAV